MQRAGDKGPERATAVGKLLKDIPDEGSRLADDGWEGDGAVIIRVLFGADDGGEESDKGGDMRKAGRVVLHAPAEGAAGRPGRTGRPPAGRGSPPETRPDGLSCLAGWRWCGERCRQPCQCTGGPKCRGNYSVARWAGPRGSEELVKSRSPIAGMGVARAGPRCGPGGRAGMSRL